MGFLSGLKKSVKSVGSSVKSAVKKASSSVSSAVKKVTTSVKSAVSSAKEHLSDFKRDVLNTNVLVSTIGGAVTGFMEGGIPGAIAGAAGGVAAGREQTLAERRAAKENWEEDVTPEEAYEIISGAENYNSQGYVDTRNSADVINETLNKAKGAVVSALTPRERYNLYTKVFGGSKVKA